MIINYSFFSYSIDTILIAYNDVGICYLSFTKKLSDLTTLFPHSTFIENKSAPIFMDVIKYIDDLLNAKNPKMTFKLDFRGTTFQIKVWKALVNSPNKLLTYSDIANIINSPNSYRAVAQACGANNIAILIPCHKIICKNGSLSGYRWGIDKKRTLIKYLEND